MQLKARSAPPTPMRDDVAPPTWPGSFEAALAAVAQTPILVRPSRSTSTGTGQAIAFLNCAAVFHR